jgi:sugar phosphate isomerase/epimerase
MKVGMSTSCFYGHFETEDAVDKLGEMGVSLCEVFLSSASEYKLPFIRDLKSRADSHGITIHSIHALGTQFEPQLFSLSPRQRADAESVFTDVIKAAGALGAAIYVMHGPTRMKRFQQHVPPDYDRLAAHAARLYNIAKDHGVRLCWENVYWCIYSQPEFAAELAKREGCGDIGYVLDIKQAVQAEHAAQEYITSTGRNLTNVHICDCYENADGHYVLGLPGEGGYDFGRLKDELDAAGYDGAVMVEVYRNNYRDFDHLKACFENMKALFEKR